MTDMEQLQEDLGFVRQAINRRSDQSSCQAACSLVWAIYVLIGFTLLDFNRVWANWFFIGAFFVAMGVSWTIGSRVSSSVGEFDRDERRRKALHYYGGTALAMIAAVGLQLVNPALRGFGGGQLCVVLIGLVYFLSGVHFDGYFLWLGPLVMAGGVAVVYVPHYPWTCLGAAMALGLAAPFFASLFGRGQNR